MKHFISPPEETTWHFDPVELLAAMRARWPLAEVSEVTSRQGNRSLEWTIVRGHNPLLGTLDRRGQVVVLDGWLEDCAAFARWFRSLVPSDQRLIFCDEGYSADVEIGIDSTEEELAAPFLAGR